MKDYTHLWYTFFTKKEFISTFKFKYTFTTICPMNGVFETILMNFKKKEIFYLPILLYSIYYTLNN